MKKKQKTDNSRFYRQLIAMGMMVLPVIVCCILMAINVYNDFKGMELLKLVGQITGALIYFGVASYLYCS